MTKHDYQPTTLDQIPGPKLYTLRNRVTGVCKGAWHVRTIEAALEAWILEEVELVEMPTHDGGGGADDMELVEISRPAGPESSEEWLVAEARVLGFTDRNHYVSSVEAQVKIAREAAATFENRVEEPS